MLKFQLFRIKVYLPLQLDGLTPPKSRSQILNTAIESVPSAELRRGQTWHIGNVLKIDEGGLYFRVGKTTRATNEVYQSGNFLDEEYETSPYTHAVVDLDLEVCAIAQKTRLSPTAKGIANQLGKLLNGTDIVRTQAVKVEVDDIPDPEGFISQLQKAFSISTFWITFSRPNPFDVNDDFIKPVQKLLNESNGAKGKMELKGENLSEGPLEELARSAASTGNDAAAIIQTRPKAKKVKRFLKRNPVILQYDDLTELEKKKQLLHEVKGKYQTVRGKKE